MDIGSIVNSTGSIVGNAATGGILGGLFSLGNAAVDFVNKRQEAKEEIDKLKITNQHEVDMAKINMDAAKENAEIQNMQTRLQGTIDEIKASFDGLKSAMDDQAGLDQRVSSRVLNVIALFRPGLTTMLILGAIATSFLSNQTASSSLVELSAMAVAWWFGDRQRMKLLGK